MKDICERFAPLMAETLHYAGSQEGLEKPLEEVRARLFDLAEQERSVSEGCFQGQSAPLRRDLEQARFAVAAWVDEQMMSSARPDAAMWAALTLQFRYFSTAEAGRLFYQELEKCLDSCGVPRRVRIAKTETCGTRSDGGGLDLESCGAPEPEEWRELDLAERLDSVQARTDEDGALSVYALCLLYGFRGALYGDPALLSRVRKASRGLFGGTPEVRTPPERRRTAELAVWGERALFIALPLLVCLVFALYCGGVLANAPFHGKF